MSNNYFDENKATENLSQPERETKVYNLNIELEEAVRERKSLMRAHGDNIKRLKSELKELLAKDIQNAEV